MFRLRNKETGLWFRSMDDADIAWTEYKDKAWVFFSKERESWEEDDEFEIVPLAEDEVMNRMGMARLPGF